MYIKESNKYAQPTVRHDGITVRNIEYGTIAHRQKRYHDGISGNRLFHHQLSNILKKRKRLHNA